MAMAAVRIMAGLSLAALLLIAVWAPAQKVRIDAQARLADAESQRERARATRDPADFAAAGTAYVRTLACWTPFDSTPATAATGLIELVPSLAPRTAARLLDEAVLAIDSLAFLFTPLAAERAELLATRTQLEDSAPLRPDASSDTVGEGRPKSRMSPNE